MTVNSDGTISTSGSFTMSAASPSPQSEFVESPANTVAEDLAQTSGCKTDDDCHSGGDMGGYCKANGDCHCTAPFFASDGSTCKLSCTPTSKPTACCRDNADCQAGGDKSAYCKTPKSTPSTTPGNGMCRCGTGFTGTTSCHQAENSSMKHDAKEAQAVEISETHKRELTRIYDAASIITYLCSIMVVFVFFFLLFRCRRAQYDVVILEDQYRTLMTSEKQV